MSSPARDGSTGRKSNLTLARMSVTLTPLTSEEVRRLPKPHVGFEAFIEPFARLYDEFAGEFGAGIDVDLMRDTANAAQSLVDARQRAAEALASIDNQIVQLRATSWSQLMLMYSRAKSAARTNKVIAVAIQALEQFMKNGPQSKKTSAPSAPSTP